MSDGYLCIAKQRNGKRNGTSESYDLLLLLLLLFLLFLFITPPAEKWENPNIAVSFGGVEERYQFTYFLAQFSPALSTGEWGKERR